MSKILVQRETIVAADRSREVGEGVQRGLVSNGANYACAFFEARESRSSAHWPITVATTVEPDATRR